MLDYGRCFGTRPIVALVEATNLPPRGVWEISEWHFILGSIIGLCYIILHSWDGVALSIQATDAVHVIKMDFLTLVFFLQWKRAIHSAY